MVGVGRALRGDAVSHDRAVPAWAIWAIVAAALGVGEIFTLSFFLGRSRSPRCSPPRA